MNTGDLQRYKAVVKACELEEFTPSEAAIRAADERVQGLASLFAFNGCRVEDLPVFLRSAYLQGVHDAAVIMKEKELNILRKMT